MYRVMLRKRPLGSRSYLGCPLRYLKTILILPWIYCILDKADGLHHHGWIHIPRLAVPQAETYVFCLCVCVFLSFHNRWMLKDMRYHFFSSLHYIFPSCAYVQVVYVFISIIESILLSCLLYRHFAIGDHYDPKHNLFNTVMLNSLAIYWNLKLIINFLFCIIKTGN